MAPRHGPYFQSIVDIPHGCYSGYHNEPKEARVQGYPEIYEGDVVHVEAHSAQVVTLGGEPVLLWSDRVWQFADEFTESRVDMEAPYTVTSEWGLTHLDEDWLREVSASDGHDAA